MKFQPESTNNQFIVQRYSKEGVVIGGETQTQSIVFGSNFPPKVWEHCNTGPLNLKICEWLYNECPPTMEVLLIGTGHKQIFPSMDIRRFFASKQCPVEYMDSQAACRTYNILITEGRQVITAIML
jgi:uncharacterized protein